MSETNENKFFHFLFVREKSSKILDRASKLIGSLGYAEKVVFFSAAALLTVSGIILGAKASQAYTTVIPAQGGVMNEGMVGSPRFINPVLANTDTDKTLVSLIYSGLLKPSETGFQPDLAESFSISPDGLIYSVKIREDAFFHDNTLVTADDVIFTIEKASDSAIKSPRQSNWEGVEVEKVDAKNVNFILKKPYSSFIESLSMGILPKHIWQLATAEEFPFSQWNIEPIGTGPYRVKSVKRNGSGIPIFMELEAWDKNKPSPAYISTLTLRFLRDEESLIQNLEEGTVDGAAGITPEEAKGLEAQGFKIIHSPMARVFGAFFNQNHAPLFSNTEVRKALDLSIDKKQLVEEVLNGFGLPLGGPTPVSLWQDGMLASTTATSTDRITRARDMLIKAGWTEKDGAWQKKTKSDTYNLKFEISTGNVPELKKAAEFLRNEWQKLGAQVEIKVFESADLNRDIIRPRKYDVLFFGEAVNREMDLYPFWHSSQRVDPGLNIALYTNISTDKLLEEIKNSTDPKLRGEKIAELDRIISGEVPAVFTYAPESIYVLSPKVKNPSKLPGGSLSDRFLTIEKWYIETDRIWNIFVPN